MSPICLPSVGTFRRERDLDVPTDEGQRAGSPVGLEVLVPREAEGAHVAVSGKDCHSGVVPALTRQIPTAQNASDEVKKRGLWISLLHLHQ